MPTDVGLAAADSRGPTPGPEAETEAEAGYPDPAWIERRLALNKIIDDALPDLRRYMAAHWPTDKGKWKVQRMHGPRSDDGPGACVMVATEHFKACADLLDGYKAEFKPSFPLYRRTLCGTVVPLSGNASPQCVVS
jgi:hypothetical protein